MKSAHAILIGALVVGCAAGCAVKEGEPDAGDSGDGDVPAACVQAGWDTSLATYQSLAEQADDTYWYSVPTYEYIHSFSWGCAYRTTVEFVEGVPVRRTFELAEVADDTMADECTGTPFVEEGDALGTMDGTFDFSIYTMEELYAGCCDLLALEPPNDYYDEFALADDGVVKHC
jgi:hypothetical protein